MHEMLSGFSFTRKESDRSCQVIISKSIIACDICCVNYSSIDGHFFNYLDYTVPDLICKYLELSQNLSGKVHVASGTPTRL